MKSTDSTQNERPGFPSDKEDREKNSNQGENHKKHRDYEQNIERREGDDEDYTGRRRNPSEEE